MGAGCARGGIRAGAGCVVHTSAGARFASVYFWIPGSPRPSSGTDGGGERSTGALPLAVAAVGVLAATWMLMARTQVDPQYWRSVYVAVVFGITGHRSINRARPSHDARGPLRGPRAFAGV